jgi:DNA-directed RNA polymerase subunit RPC12/RpoP
MKSQQIGSEIEPPKSDDTLALIIQCPKCNTQRAFRVNDSFMLAITRKSSGCQYNTACDTCGYKVSVQLIWTKRHLGWTVEGITFKKAVAVEDDFGLKPITGNKEI